jgi:hypothetical protein
MTASLRALLAGAIDYAGLFPPAKLPLEQAFSNYLRYRREPEAWMLGSFVIPAARLTDLVAFEQQLREEVRPVHLTVLGRGGDTLQAVQEGLTADAQEIRSCCQRFPGKVSVDAVELRIPTAIAGDAFFAHLQGRLVRSLAADFPQPLTVFHEVSPDSEWKHWLPVVLPMLRETNGYCAKSKTPFRGAGFKLRCGGLDAAAFPTVEQVAFVLRESRRFGVPLKLTAGLHHPLPHWDAAIGVKAHGFINIFVAMALLYAGPLDEGELLELLADDDPGHFHFEDTLLRWKSREAEHNAFISARREGIVAFGSCSFDEPRDDLRALGWL